nr:hypothetical protein BaRGS_018441 [Batillaria attramentaria]
MASVRVVSILPEGEPQGTFDIQITPTMTGQDLLRRLCRDANVPLNPEYILQTDDGNVYGIVFDAGSSHTSMFVYKWDGDKVNKTAVAAQDGPKCNTVGS